MLTISYENAFIVLFLVAMTFFCLGGLAVIYGDFDDLERRKK